MLPRTFILRGAGNNRHGGLRGAAGDAAIPRIQMRLLRHVVPRKDSYTSYILPREDSDTFCFVSFLLMRTIGVVDSHREDCGGVDYICQLINVSGSGWTPSLLQPLCPLLAELAYLR